MNSVKSKILLKFRVSKIMYYVAKTKGLENLILLHKLSALVFISFNATKQISNYY